MAEGERLATLTLMAETIRDRLVMQRDSIERLETKGVILLGFTVTAAQFVLTADDMNDWWRAAALLAYATAFLFGLIVVAPYRHDYPPEPTYFFDTYNARSAVEVVNVLAATRAQAFETNTKTARSKGRAWWRALALLALAVVLSGVAGVSGSSGDDECDPGKGTRRSGGDCSYDDRE